MSDLKSRLKTWLTLSLILNVFLLGAVGGGLYRWQTRQQQAVEQRGLRFAASELSESRQAQFKLDLKAMRRDNFRHGLGRAAREGRLDVIAALSATPFDVNALNAALARTRDADVAVRTRIEAVVSNFAATLTPEERAKLVDGLERRGPLRIGLENKDAHNAPAKQAPTSSAE